MTAPPKTYLGFQRKATHVKDTGGKQSQPPFTVGQVAITDGSPDVTNRTPTPRLIIYSDGYGTPVFAEPGDYVVMAGQNNPPDLTERGAATFEPTKLIYVGPSKWIAAVVARAEFDKTIPHIDKYRLANEPIPTCWVYYYPKPDGWTDRDPPYMQEVAVTDILLGRPEPTPAMKNSHAFLTQCIEKEDTRK